jgi:hypothetical protein
MEKKQFASDLAKERRGLAVGDTNKNKTANIVINSGIWQRVRGGTTKTGSTNYNINITVNGGTFREGVVLSSAAASAVCSDPKDSPHWWGMSPLPWECCWR